MAREHISSASDSGGARRTAAVLAVLLLSASALAPASIAAADGLGDPASVFAAAGNTDETTVANDETTTVGDDNDTTTVANDESVTIRGRVEDADADPVANETVRLERDGNLTGENSTDGTLADENRTDERGRYDLQGERNRSYELTFRQSDENVSDRQSDGIARDGIPAVYAVGQVNASTNLTRNVSLPAASVLNVTVEAENGTRVENATVRVTHAREGANATVIGRTDERGRLTVGGRVGVEVAGNVTVAVDAPNASLSDAEVALSVANATERTVVLDLNDSEPPTLRYDVGPNPVNVSEPVTFDASGSTDESGIAETTWTIEGQPWNTRRVSDSFSEPGNYSVELSATDWAGNENNTTVSVTVVDERDPEAALAVNATTALTNESVEFDASNATDNHRIAEYRWDFDGDGTPDRNTTDPTVSHAYARNGTYDATVVVVDETGNRANATRQITVEFPPPTANFSVTTLEPEEGESVTFDASPSTAVTGIENYTWTFEGGQQVPGERVFTTSFPDSGTYNVTLTVTDERGRTDERTRTIEVPNEPPAADAGENRSVVAGTAVSLDGRYSTDPDDDFSLRWNQTAGPSVNLSNASAAEPSFTAPEVNETTVLRFELTVTDTHGVTDEDSVAVTVAPRTEPNVSHAPANPVVGESVTFAANRSGDYRWDFDGDGTPEATTEAANVTNATATHAFDAAGEYNVTLIDAVGREVVHAVNVTRANASDADAGGNATDSGGNTTDSGGNATSSGGTSGSTSTGGGSGGTSGGGGTGGVTGSSAGTGDTGSTGGGTGGTGGQSGAATGGDSATGASSDSRNGADSDGQSAESPPSPTAVTVERVREGVLASVENATADDPAKVRLPEEFGGNDSAFEAVTVVPDGASNFSLSVSRSATRPEGTPSSGADAVLSYLEVEKRNVTNAEIASARFRFRVSAAALDASGVSPEAVTLYRYSGGTWEALATSLVGEQGGTYRFEAVSPGFSVFAVGLENGSAGADDGTATGTTETGTPDDEGDGGEASATSEPGGAENGETTGTEQDGGVGGVDSNTLLLGLFAAALLAAALWGYLLS